MTNPVALLRHVADGDLRYDALMFWCPADNDLHMLPVNAEVKTPSWTWDGNLEQPTLSPSILTRWGAGKVCHSYLRAGQWEFLSDCTHELAGKTVPMVPLPDWVVDE